MCFRSRLFGIYAEKVLRIFLYVNLTDLVQILQEAQQRWLRPSEICEILRNYQKFQLTPDPPVQPAGLLLALFSEFIIVSFCSLCA